MLLGRYNNEDISKNSGHPEIFSDCQSFFLIFAVLVCQQVDFSNNLASKFLISALYFLDVLCSLLSYLFCFCPGLFRFLFFAYLHFLLLFLHSLFFYIFCGCLKRSTAVRTEASFFHFNFFSAFGTKHNLTPSLFYNFYSPALFFIFVMVISLSQFLHYSMWSNIFYRLLSYTYGCVHNNFSYCSVFSELPVWFCL